MELFLKIFPDGCNTNQSNELHGKIFDKYGNIYLDEKVEWPLAIRKLDHIRSSVEMLSSCFTYNELDKWSTKYYNEYLKEYEELGGNKVDFDKCISAQQIHLNKCRILKNVHTDSEGLSYNSLVEPIEKCNFEYLNDVSTLDEIENEVIKLPYEIKKMILKALNALVIDEIDESFIHSDALEKTMKKFNAFGNLNVKLYEELKDDSDDKHQEGSNIYRIFKDDIPTDMYLQEKWSRNGNSYHGYEYDYQKLQLVEPYTELIKVERFKEI